MKYRKKSSIVVEAYQTDKEMIIPTLEGDMHASIGDYIITGVRGEQYPCKPDIFEETYEEVKDESKVTKEQLLLALETIRRFCREFSCSNEYCDDCHIRTWCDENNWDRPDTWKF